MVNYHWNNRSLKRALNKILFTIFKLQNWYDDCVSCLADMFNVSLFKKMTFNCMCLGTIILFIWFIVPYFYLAEHMVQKGYTEDEGAFMLSLIGITNTIGMVIVFIIIYINDSSKKYLQKKLHVMASRLRINIT